MNGNTQVLMAPKAGPTVAFRKEQEECEPANAGFRGRAPLPRISEFSVDREFENGLSQIISKSSGRVQRVDFNRTGRVVFLGDLDLTLDAARLTTAARCSGESLFVLREGGQPGKVSELPGRAVWFTGLTEVTVPLAEISRLYGRGVSSATLVEECAELQARLRAQLSVHCYVAGCWLTRRKANIAVCYCGPALFKSELSRKGHGVERVMEPD